MGNHNISNAELRTIRENVDPETLFHVLGLTRDERRSRLHDWWTLSPLSQENTPSFHLNTDTGAWFCFSTHQGGGPIELVQAMMRVQTGKGLNCYQAGKWLVEKGISRLSGDPRPVSEPMFKPRSEEKKENRPIRQTLIKSLSQLGEHEEFKRRGIGKTTCEYLGCGYLDPKDSKSSLAGRVVFQIRGIGTDEAGDLVPVVLSHIGRATTQEQEEKDGKWSHYGGFYKSLELYNLDKLFFDIEARKQIEQTGRILVVEGCFDVAKLIEAGILNTVATFGAFASDEQIELLNHYAHLLGAREVLIWTDNDKAGQLGLEKTLVASKEAPVAYRGFDWGMMFDSTTRGKVGIPEGINDPGSMSIKQLQWLRNNRCI